MFIGKRVAGIVAAALLSSSVHTQTGHAQTGAEPETAGPYNRMEIRNVTLIDGTGAPAYGPVNILIEKDKIVRVGRSKVMKGFDGETTGDLPVDRVIDGTGKYVMPGIIDVHTHPSKPADYAYKLWLSHGVTAIRIFTMGNPADAIAEKKRIMSGQILGPKMWVYPFWPATARASRPEEVPAMVKEWKALGADGVKAALEPSEYPDVLKALGAETQKNGMGLAIHISQNAEPGINAMIAANDNVSTIEHYYGYAESVMKSATVPSFDPEFNYFYEPAHYRTSADIWKEADLDKLYGEVVPALVKLGQEGRFTMVPTFATYEDQSDVTRAVNLPWFGKYLLPSMSKAWNTNDGTVHSAIYENWTSRDEAMYKKMYGPWMEMVKRFKNQGGHVALGADSGTTFNLYGFGTVREMELLLNAGFDPLEVIRSATQEGARVLNEPKMGVIRPGYAADLLLLDSNPIGNFKLFYGMKPDTDASGKPQRRTDIRYTIVGGKVIDANALLLDVEAMAKSESAAAAAPEAPHKH